MKKTYNKYRRADKIYDNKQLFLFIIGVLIIFLSTKPEYREKYDLCVSRAVANLSTLSEYCLPYVKVGGKFIPYKSEKMEEEINVAKKAISVLGGKIEKCEEFYLPDSDIYRNLIVIQKNKETPKKFPRKAGLPSKEPIK